MSPPQKFTNPPPSLHTPFSFRDTPSRFQILPPPRVLFLSEVTATPRPVGTLSFLSLFPPSPFFFRWLKFPWTPFCLSLIPSSSQSFPVRLSCPTGASRALPSSRSVSPCTLPFSARRHNLISVALRSALLFFWICLVSTP